MTKKTDNPDATEEPLRVDSEKALKAAALYAAEPELYATHLAKIAKRCGCSKTELKREVEALTQAEPTVTDEVRDNALEYFGIKREAYKIPADMAEVLKVTNRLANDRQSASEAITLPGYSFSEAVQRKLKVTPYIVKNVINEGEVGFMFGDSGTMKSFVAADMAYHVAICRDWNGFRVNKQGAGVLIVLAEGQAGYEKRVQALYKKHGVDAPIWVVPEPVDVVRHPEKLTSWIELAEARLGRKVGLILMDTFSLMMGDGDESSNRDVGQTMNSVRAAVGGRAVLFIHHTGHGDKQRERGAYQIRGNADRRIIVSRDDGGRGRVITVEGLKAKDEVEFPAFNVTYEVIVLGIDQDGDDITSLVIAPTDQTPVAASEGNKKPTKALGYVLEAIKVAGSTEKEVVRSHFYMLYPNANEDTKRNQFSNGWNAYMNTACRAADQAARDSVNEG